MMNRREPDVIDLSMIGTLPPLKGISPYCAELTRTLSDRLSVEFLDFKRLYPERFYPGGTKEADLYPLDLSEIDFHHRKMIDFANPYTWIKAGLSLKGRIAHAQWWTGILAPVYYTILAAARMRGKRIIITIHNAEPHENNPVYNMLHRSILHLGDEFIVHNGSNREKVLAQTGNGSRPVHVIPHIPFASAQTGQESGEREEARRDLGIENGGPLLLFFGNIREYKGLDVLLRAMPEVIKAHPDLMLMVVGQPWVNWGEYDRIINEEGIEKHLKAELRYLPFTELRKRIIASDLTVFPFKSLDSASGSVVLTRSLGRPVVMSDIACMDDVRGEGVFLASPGSPNSLAASIDGALKLLQDQAVHGGQPRLKGPGTSVEDVRSMHLDVYERAKDGPAVKRRRAPIA